MHDAQQTSVARAGEQRNIQLDGLRAAAVLLVLISHYSVLKLWKDGLWGAIGVHAFFVLSGFLITGILLDAKDKTERGEGTVRHALKAFYVRRALRIFPLYYLFLAFLITFNIDGARHDAFFHLGYASNVGMAVQDTHYGHNSHFWSLAVEEQFYLIWPWAILLLRRSHVLPAIAILGAAAVAYRITGLSFGWNDYALRMATPAVLDSLAGGAFLSIMHRSPEAFRNVRVWLVRLGLFVAGPLVLVMSVLASRGALPYALQILVFTPLVALASLGIIDRAVTGIGGVTGRVLESRVAVYLGQRSYGIYVLHLCVPYLLEALEARAGIPVNHMPVLSVLVPLAITLVLAELSWRIVEKPFNGLKRHFEYNRVRTPKAAASLDTGIAPG